MGVVGEGGGGVGGAEKIPFVLAAVSYDRIPGNAMSSPARNNKRTDFSSPVPAELFLNPLSANFVHLLPLSLYIPLFQQSIRYLASVREKSRDPPKTLSSSSSRGLMRV